MQLHRVLTANTAYNTTNEIWSSRDHSTNYCAGRRGQTLQAGPDLSQVQTIPNNSYVIVKRREKMKQALSKKAFSFKMKYIT